MTDRKHTYRDYVQVFIPTKDEHGRPLSKVEVAIWQDLVAGVFRRFVEGSYTSPYYAAKGDFLASSGEWISEPIFIIKAFAPRKACRELIDALENEVVNQMGVALRQESVALESSLEGLAVYET